MSAPPPYNAEDNKMGGPPQGNPQQPQPAPGPTVTVVQQPVVVTTTMVQQFRESPLQTVCPYCHANIVTAVSYDVGTFAYLMGTIICLLGCAYGCCFIPCCVDGCQDAVHHCPNCKQQVGRWSRM